MLYSEASYFDGYHFQHIADWQEWKRICNIKKDANRACRQGMRLLKQCSKET
jgi:hypothetical protein